MAAHDTTRTARFWRPTTATVSGMFRVEHEDRLRTTFAEDFAVVAVVGGAYDGWYRGAVERHVAGSLKLKEPGEIHRGLRVHAPYTLAGAVFSPELVAAAAGAVGLRGPVRFRASGFAPGEPATRLAFAMHDALARDDATEIERGTRVTEALAALLAEAPPPRCRAPVAVRRARDYLHGAVADKVTLEDVAAHAGVDKFHLVRAFRCEMGVPPYEYLTFLRVARARTLLRRGMRVADAAQDVGFCDESQLHRHFRRIVGVTPGRYARGFAPPRAAPPTSPNASRCRGRTIGA